MNRVLADRYVLKGLIGRGGMADVYLAEDSILKRTVAVKIMRSSLTGDPIYVTRFHREASAAAALSHKNIIEIYDVGDEGDEYFIVMEYVPGQTLKDLLNKRGALHYVEAIDIMKQIVSATAKAHSMGIIHRDLKPQNIMITDSGVVKIGDFGIASIQSLSQVTQSDTIMGSLHYLAPEIARGEKATAQSDLYALGIVFYELLRGEVPFNGESPVNIALKHMRDEIPSVRTFNHSIPQSVENIIIKATAKNVRDRYHNANEMLDDLNTCLSRKDEKKLVFVYDEPNNQTTIIANDKILFNQEKNDNIQSIEEDVKTNKLFAKKKEMLIGGCIIGALIVFGLIYFLFFRGSKSIKMPDVSYMTQQEAITYLQEFGLKVNNQVMTEVSDDIDEGKVISTNPNANTLVKKGDVVDLVISSGKYIVIDNYIGKNYSDIQNILKNNGFLVYMEQEVSDQPEGTIIKQSLEVGTKIDPNRVDKNITLIVSKGYSVIVPNVYGQDINKAKNILESAGFVVRFNVLESPTSEAEIKTMQINVVQKQSIDAFTVVKEKNQEITLSYYDHIPTMNPSTSNPDNTPSQTNPDINTNE